MTTDLSLATISAIGGILLSGAITYSIYKVSVKKWFGEKRKFSTAANINYFLGCIACILIFSQMTGVANELLFVVFNGGQVRANEIYKNLLVIVSVSSFTFVVGFIVNIFSSQEIKQSYSSSNQQYKNLTDDELLVDAVQGDEKSQFKIGQQYWLGEKRIQDATVAYAWLRIAKGSGSEAARFYLDNTVFKQLHQQDIDNSIKLYENLKEAIKKRDANLCELLIRKSFDDRNIINDKDAPSYIKPEPTFKSYSTNLIYNKFERDREEVEKIRNITEEPQWINAAFRAFYIVVGVPLLALIAYSFTPRQTTQSEISNQKTEIKENKVVDDVKSYRISECSRVENDELIVETVFEKIKINYSANTITTFPSESQNQSMQVVSYEDCSLKDEKKSCIKFIDEKTKSQIKFDVNNNLFTNEIISETDGNEAIKVKWACISSPIIDM